MNELDFPFPDAPAPGAHVELSPGVRWLRMPMPGSLNHINLYLLRCDGGWTAVDTGLGDGTTREHWEQVFVGSLDGEPIRRVLVTHLHPDHIGQAGWLCERWQVPLAMSRTEYYQARVFSQPDARGPSWQADAFYRGAGLLGEEYDALRERTQRGGGYAEMVTPLPPSYERLKEGDRLRLADTDFTVRVGAGHSPEHVCLYSAERDLLVAGDQVLPSITSNVSVHANEPEADPLSEWLASHERFLELPDETLVLPAHGLPFRGLRRRLRDLVDHHEERMALLRERCREPATARDGLDVLFRRELDDFQRMMALGETIAHLHTLLARGDVTRRRDERGCWLFETVADG